MHRLYHFECTFAPNLYARTPKKEKGADSLAVAQKRCRIENVSQLRKCAQMNNRIRIERDKLFPPFGHFRILTVNRANSDWRDKFDRFRRDRIFDVMLNDLLIVICLFFVRLFIKTGLLFFFCVRWRMFNLICECVTLSHRWFKNVGKFSENPSWNYIFDWFIDILLFEINFRYEIIRFSSNFPMLFTKSIKFHMKNWYFKSKIIIPSQINFPLCLESSVR